MRRLVILTALGLLASSGTASATVRHWGSYGKNGEVTRSPTAVGGLENVIAIDAQNRAGYMLESNGTLWAVGAGSVGALGNGLTENSFTTAVQVSFPAGTQISAIGEARAAGYAIDSEGNGWSWGKSFQGSLCLGVQEEEEGEEAPGVLVPQRVPGIEQAVAVQGGSNHVLWLNADGTVEACGSNASGALGAPPNVRRAVYAVPVAGLPEPVVEISSGQATSCARTAAGAVYVWGGDANGQVGNGVEQPGVYQPYHVPLPGPASQISCGGNIAANGHTFALVNGALYGWGADNAGQIGDGTTVNKPHPTLVNLGKHFTQVVAAGEASLGLTAAGEVYVWGSNVNGMLATGNKKPPPKVSFTPLLVSTGVSEISSTAYDALER